MSASIFKQAGVSDLFSEDLPQLNVLQNMMRQMEIDCRNVNREDMKCNLKRIGKLYPTNTEEERDVVKHIVYDIFVYVISSYQIDTVDEYKLISDVISCIDTVDEYKLVSDIISYATINHNKVYNKDRKMCENRRKVYNIFVEEFDNMYMGG